MRSTKDVKRGPSRRSRLDVSAQSLQAAVECLRGFGARRVLLFGSLVDAPELARDVDLAVEGIPLGRLLDADVAVHAVLGVPTDLVSREENPRFLDVIKDYGRVLYEEGPTHS
jgi:predicted nucleotidyltransferase